MTDEEIEISPDTASAPIKGREVRGAGVFQPRRRTGLLFPSALVDRQRDVRQDRLRVLGDRSTGVLGGEGGGQNSNGHRYQRLVPACLSKPFTGREWLTVSVYISSRGGIRCTRRPGALARSAAADHTGSSTSHLRTSAVATTVA